MSDETLIIDCWMCGSEFNPAHKYQIYCCPACEEKAARTWEEYNAPRHDRPAAQPVQLNLFGDES